MKTIDQKYALTSVEGRSPPSTQSSMRSLRSIAANILLDWLAAQFKVV